MVSERPLERDTIMSLTDFAIRNIKPASSSQKLSDGGNLYLLVSTAGGKLWRLNLPLLGQAKDCVTGILPGCHAGDGPGASVRDEEAPSKWPRSGRSSEVG
jgi:hypothetical protein